jgi:hypothetical protein
VHQSSMCGPRAVSPGAMERGGCLPRRASSCSPAQPGTGSGGVGARRRPPRCGSPRGHRAATSRHRPRHRSCRPACTQRERTGEPHRAGPLLTRLRRRWPQRRVVRAPPGARQARVAPHARPREARRELDPRGSRRLLASLRSAELSVRCRSCHSTCRPSGRRPRRDPGVRGRGAARSSCSPRERRPNCSPAGCGFMSSMREAMGPPEGGQSNAARSATRSQICSQLGSGALEK